MNLLNLRSITAYACIGSQNPALLDRSVKIMRYCQKIARWHSIVILTATPPEAVDCGINYIQIPEFADVPFGKSWQVFLAKTRPYILCGLGADHFMFIHEDGFPVEPDLWNPSFLEYDYIAAPWDDAVVGGGGMSMMSRHFLESMKQLSFYADVRDGNNEDEFACRANRKTLAGMGVKFAPPLLAYQYCTESNSNEEKSFAFHGKKWTPDKYTPGWQKVEEALK